MYSGSFMVVCEENIYLIVWEQLFVNVLKGKQQDEVGRVNFVW